MRRSLMVLTAVALMAVMLVNAQGRAFAVPSGGHKYQDISKYQTGAKKNWMFHYTNAYSAIVSGPPPGPAHLGRLSTAQDGGCRPSGSSPSCNFFSPTVYTSAQEARAKNALPAENLPTGFIPIPPGKAMPPGLRPGVDANGNPIPIDPSTLPPGQRKRGYAGNTVATPMNDQPGGGIEFKHNSSFTNPNGKTVWINPARGYKFVPFPSISGTSSTVTATTSTISAAVAGNSRQASQGKSTSVTKPDNSTKPKNPKK